MIFGVGGQGPVRLVDSGPVDLAATAVEHRESLEGVLRWKASSSLFFGTCTTGVPLRIPLEASHPGRWWWVSELRTPEEIRLRLGARDLGVHGTSRRFDERPAGSLAVAIPLDLRGGPETLYVSASDPQGDVVLDVRFVPDGRLPSWLQSHAARDAWVLGMFCTVLLLAVYLCWTVRERAYVWYATYIGLGVLWVSTKTGFASALLWPDHPDWNHAGPSFASRAALVFFLLFLRELLGLPRSFPKLGRLLDFGIAWEAVCAVFALSSLWLPTFHAQVQRHCPPEILEGPTLVLGLGLVAWCAHRGDGLARRVFVSCLPLLVAAVFGSIWDLLHPDGSPNLDTGVAIGGALLENLLTTSVLAGEVRRRVKFHEDLVRDFERHLAESIERYRLRTAKELHDDLSQRLLAARLALHAEGFRPKGGGTDAETQLQSMADAIRNLSHDLHPWNPGSRTFREALEDMAGQFGGARVAVKLDLRADFDLLPTVGGELLRVVQEASTNAVRHGRAQGVEIGTRTVDGDLELSIRDDGKGMVPSRSATGDGLRNIRSRIAWLGGTVQIESVLGEGTTLRVRVPLVRAMA